MLLSETDRIAGDVINRIAEAIEELDQMVDDDNFPQFQEIISRFLNPVDPHNELTIFDAVKKLSIYRASELFQALLLLNYGMRLNHSLRLWEQLGRRAL